MNRVHAKVLALLLGVAALLGTFAAARSANLAASAQATTQASIAARQHRLDKTEAALRRALARRPPALPTAARPVTPAAPRIRYVRPAPIVIPRPSAQDREDDGEHGELEAADD